MSVLFFVGTRPEAIKVVPAYFNFLHHDVGAQLCSTQQHTVLLDDVLTTFGVVPDHVCQLQQTGGDLSVLFSRLLMECSRVIAKVKPTWVVVQGDTATAYAAACAAFFSQIKILHIEAGLRTYDMHQPFPEEFFRQSLSKITTLHAAPTQAAADALLREGIAPEQISVTGNTVVDALNLVGRQILDGKLQPKDSLQESVIHVRRQNKKIILLTLHRREIHGKKLIEILGAIKAWIKTHPSVKIFYTQHPNPAVLQALTAAGFCPGGELDGKVIFLQPLAYIDMVYLLTQADLVVTDSGGLQEEAVALGKKVVCVRECTERLEGVQQGYVRLVGTHPENITAALNAQNNFVKLPPSFVYGDGNAAEKIYQFWLANQDRSLYGTAKDQKNASVV